MFGKQNVTGKAIVCPKCGSNNVQIQMIETGSKTRKHGNGLLGHVNNQARAVTGLMTLGASNLVWKKSKGGEKTKIQNAKVCICQNCGNSWELRG